MIKAIKITNKSKIDDNELSPYSLLNRKIDLITPNDSYKPYIKRTLKKLAIKNPENASIICDYITNEQTEFNIKDSTKYNKILVLMYLSRSLYDSKSFRDMTKHDILTHMNSLKSSTYSPNNTKKWIGTYNYRHMVFLKFFKWLYNQQEPDPRKRETPECMLGVRKLPKKEKTSYNSGQIWDRRENTIFLKYCPLSRDRCYHAMTMDTSARPHELLGLKIKDLEFNTTEDGHQYALVRIRDGKTGPRTVPLIDALPYVKEWIQQEHPFGSNLESWLFVSIGNNHKSRLGHNDLVQRYGYYKKTYFPSLLLDPTISEPDKSVIRNLITKPFNPYVLRHSSLTEKSTYLSEAVLRNHAGWTADSGMPRVYLHLKDESSKILLEKKGIITKQDREIATINKSKICTNCNETNRLDAKWCNSCKMVLSYASYQETLQKEKEKENQIKELVTKVDKLTEDNSRTQDFILKMFDKYEDIDNIERQKLSKKIKEANDKGECYAIYPEDVKPPTEKEILEKALKDDINSKWFVLLRDNPELQKRYNIKL